MDDKKPIVRQPAAKASEPASEQNPGVVLESVLQPDVNPSPEDVAIGQASADQGAPVRRETVQTKEYRAQEQVSPAARIESSLRTPAEAAEAKQLFMFMSPYKDLQIYADLGHKEKDKDGTIIPRYVPIKFSNGVFRTSSPVIAAAIRSHPRCGTQTFREELNAQTIAVRAAAAAARDGMRAPTFAGTSASSDGSDALFHHNDHELAGMESKIFSL